GRGNLVRLGARLLVAQLPLAVCLALVAFLAIETISSLGVRSNLILKDNYRSVLAAQRMIDAIDQLNAGALLVLIGEHDPEVAEERRRFESELRVQEGNISEVGEQEATSRLRERWQTYQSDLDAFLAIEDLPKAKAYYLGSLRSEFATVKSSAEEVLALN